MKIKKHCPVCGIIYEAELQRLKFGRQTTCSRLCSYRLRAAQLENKIACICAVCGQEFKRPPSQIKGKHGSQFCSPACHYKGRSIGKTRRIIQKPYNISEKGRLGWLKGAKKTRETRIKRNNYGHSKETIAKIRHATICAIAEGRVPARSKIEEEVRDFLKLMGVEFFYQHPIRDNAGRYICVFDFFVPKHNTVIEVNGTFWHSDKRFFPNGPVHESQKRGAIRWKRKIGLIRDLGYHLIIAWEYDIKKRGTEYFADIFMPFI